MPASDAFEQIGNDIDFMIKFSGDQATAADRLNNRLQPLLIVTAVLAASIKAAPAVSWAYSSQVAAWLSFIFSLAVAVLTGYDKWKKPEVRWKASYRYNDYFMALKREWTFISSDDANAVRALQDRLTKLSEEYRADVL